METVIKKKKKIKNKNGERYFLIFCGNYAY